MAVDPVSTAILIIPATIKAIGVLLRSITGERNRKRQTALIEEASEKLTELTGAVSTYAEAHYELRDWKRLHDYLSRILDMLDSPEAELRKRDFDAFAQTWAGVKVRIADLAMTPLESLPSDWEFETPGGVWTKEWRQQLRLHSDRLSQANSVSAANRQVKSVRELIRVLTVRANTHLIILAGNLADWSTELKGKLEA